MDKEIPTFLSRKQLSFQEATSFAIQIRTVATPGYPLRIRGFTKEGIFEFLHTPNGNLTEKIEVFNVPDVPIMLTVDNEGGDYAGGTCYIRVSLLLNGTRVYQFSEGYISTKRGISWPNLNREQPELRVGDLTRGISADPAAGAEITYTIPTSEQWKIVSMRFTLVTDATVANRRPHLTITYGGNKMLDVFGSTDQTASQTIIYSVFNGVDLAAGANDNDILIPLPDITTFQAAMIISTETTGLQAGDNFSALQIFYERRILENV